MIWLGGFSTDQISYREGRRIDISSDTSFNDWLTVNDDGFTLYFEPSNTGYFYSSQKEKLSTPAEAADYLWKRFGDSLERS